MKWWALLSLCLVACGSAPKPIPTAVASARTFEASLVVEPKKRVDEAPARVIEPPAEHWYFEALAPNGRHALLRRLDAVGHTTLQTRVVDVDTNVVLEEVTMPQLAKFPATTIGRSPADLAKLDALFAAPPFAEDLVRAGRIASPFPFGACGRVAGSAQAIAFNAGDWLYVADAQGKVKKRLTQEAAYDPRVSADGKFVFFRRASGNVDKVLARYELFVMPTDMSQPPKALVGTAGITERFTTATDGNAVVIASHEPQIHTCVLSVAQKAPFAVKKLGCLDGGEALVESAISPKARWAALTTKTVDAERNLAWRLRVVSLGNGAVVLDVPADAGFSLRAISDAGVLVQSGIRGVIVDDAMTKKRRILEAPLDLGHRGFFRSGTELVVLRGAGVTVVDLRDAR